MIRDPDIDYPTDGNLQALSNAALWVRGVAHLSSALPSSSGSANAPTDGAGLSAAPRPHLTYDRMPSATWRRTVFLLSARGYCGRTTTLSRGKPVALQNFPSRSLHDV